MSDKDLIQEARRWIEIHRENSYQREAAKRMKRLADALEARQVDEAALAGVLARHRGWWSPSPTEMELCRDEARAVVEFLGERHEPELIKCDYCGDDLPSVEHRSHLPTTPDLQRRGFDADKIVCGNCAKSPSAPQPSESLVCEPRQDSMLLWEGGASASTYPAYEHDDAEESEAEYKDHAATVTGEPTDAQIEAGLKKVDWDAIRAGEADPEEAAGVAVRAALVAAGAAHLGTITGGKE